MQRCWCTWLTSPRLWNSQSRLKLARVGKIGRLSRTISSGSTTRKSILPERTLLYHAGTGRTVIIGSMKLTAFFFFAFSAFLVAPSQLFHPDSPAWVPPAVVVGGLIPVLVVAQATAPFVTYIHLRIPFYARRSKDSLMKFVNNTVPLNTEIDLTTIGHFGWPHVHRMPLAELRKAKFALSAANLKRVLPSSSSLPKRSWWKGSLPTKFYVVNEPIGRRGPTPWQKVWEQLNGP
ncbi:MAG: hypothetical protein Q9186_005844 [Xanthomendoza sp. 1 TL-2023]